MKGMNGNNAKEENTVSLNDDLRAKGISKFEDVIEFLGL
jgi:hypothetical protein